MAVPDFALWRSVNARTQLPVVSRTDVMAAIAGRLVQSDVANKLVLVLPFEVLLPSPQPALLSNVDVAVVFANTSLDVILYEDVAVALSQWPAQIFWISMRAGPIPNRCAIAFEVISGTNVAPAMAHPSL